MFFGISSGELLVIVGVGAVVLGRKDLVAIAGTAGKLTGRAAGYLSAARQRFAVFTNSGELTKLHEDVQGTMLQLESIREELRRGMVSRTAYTRLAAALPAPEASAAVSRQGAVAPGEETGSLPQHVSQEPESQHDWQPPGAAAKAGAGDIQLPAAAAAAAVQEQQAGRGAVGRATPLPALSSLHFATSSTGASDALSLVGDQSFDSAAYAAYQALFDVPAGRHAPTLARHRTCTPAESDVVEQRTSPRDVAIGERTTQTGKTGLEPGANAPRLAMDQAMQEEMAASFAAFLKTDQGQRVLQQAMRDAARS